jgi:hypothetical protein
MTAANHIPILYNLLSNTNSNSSSNLSNSNVAVNNIFNLNALDNEALLSVEEEFNLGEILGEGESGSNIEGNLLNSQTIISNLNLGFKFPIQGAEEESIKMFNLIRKNEMNSIIHANIYNNFIPSWSVISKSSNREIRDNSIGENLRDNIYNTYMKISKIYKKIKHKGKVKENNKSKT